MTRRWWSRLTSGWTAPDPAPEPAYPYPDPADEAERIVRMAQDRRESAFEAAVSEMMRPRLTTEAILDGYLVLVIPAEERAS